jgi:hypothetical protein
VPDICSIISGSILTSSYATDYPYGAVIDARGLYNNLTDNSISCASGTPFSNLTAPPPSTTILLPSTTIPITTTWTIPNNTRIVGEGRNTYIQAGSGMTGYMIEMGNSTLCPSGGCTSIGIEDLLLDASQDTEAVNGIENKWAQDSSYVDSVNMFMFQGIGLHIAAAVVSGTTSPGGANSGPYNNISMGTPNSGNPECVLLETQTRGIHGVTCVGNTNTAKITTGNAGIYVNAGNNTVEDIHVESFLTGIAVGDVPSTSPAVSNVVISNATGSSGTINVVRLCGAHAQDPADYGTCTNTTGTVEDVVVLQATSLDTPPTSPVIEDDVTGTTIHGCATCSEPLSSAIYVLGEPIGTSGTEGISRFATTPANSGTYAGSSTVPTWGAGNTQITNGSACLTPGSLYSYTSSTGSVSSVYACSYTGWQSLP